MTDPKTKAALAAARAKLSALQRTIALEHGTERAWSGPWLDEKRAGVYACVVCGEPLFDAADKYDSGSGWPSFMRPIGDGALGESVDHTIGVPRTEIHCKRCGAHMGHVFPDGPQPTGLRFCINGAVLDFRPEGEEGES